MTEPKKNHHRRGKNNPFNNQPASPTKRETVTLEEIQRRILRCNIQVLNNTPDRIAELNETGIEAVGDE